MAKNTVEPRHFCFAPFGNGTSLGFRFMSSASFSFESRVKYVSDVSVFKIIVPSESNTVIGELGNRFWMLILTSLRFRWLFNWQRTSDWQLLSLLTYDLTVPNYKWWSPRVGNRDVDVFENYKKKQVCPVTYKKNQHATHWFIWIYFSKRTKLHGFLQHSGQLC